MNDLAGVMRKSREMDAVFLARNALGRLALLNIVNLDCLVVSGRNQKISLVIEVQRGYVWLGLRICASAKCLENKVPKSVISRAGTR
jgi:hypothetical protein